MNRLWKLTHNLRFYILCASILVSASVLAYLRLKIPSDQLFYIRSEQIFGLLSVTCVYLAVLLTPLSKLVGKRDWMSNLLFARRAVGVSAAYFAALHINIALFRQAGGLPGLALLPSRFQLSFGLGVLAFIILFLMAITSMDWVINKMTFPRWKRLHRFIYAAGILIIVHVWMIGTHITQPFFKYTAFGALVLLIGLEALRIGKQLAQKLNFDIVQEIALSACLFILMLFALLALPNLVDNYHSGNHSSHKTEQQL